jgi:hypothetical protein
MPNTFLLYGANGYTGELITRYAVELGMKPILAGRNAIKVEELAKKHHLDYRVFSPRRDISPRRRAAGGRHGAACGGAILADIASDGRSVSKKQEALHRYHRRDLCLRIHGGA